MKKASSQHGSKSMLDQTVKNLPTKYNQAVVVYLEKSTKSSRLHAQIDPVSANPHIQHPGTMKY